MAFLAEAVGAAGHAIERGVDFAEERLEVFIVRSAGERGFEAEFALGDLGLQEVCFESGHDDLQDSLANVYSMFQGCAALRFLRGEDGGFLAPAKAVQGRDQLSEGISARSTTSTSTGVFS